MTPKEKAEELVDKYRGTIMSFLSDNMKDMNAKKCALIALDETLSVVKYYEDKYTTDGFKSDNLLYWEEVKQEIEKL